MEPIKFPVQKTLAERQAPASKVDVPRYARALLEHVAARARAEQRALVRLKAEKTPQSAFDLTPSKAIGIISSHFDDVEVVHEEAMKDLERLVLGVSVIVAVSKKTGLSPAQIRDMDLRELTKHVSLEAAMAAKEAFANPDVRLIAEGHAADGEFTWERGETYSNADHLVTAVDEIGLRAQDRVKVARDYYRSGRGGTAGRAVNAGLDGIEAVRGAVVDVVDTAADYYAGASGPLAAVGGIVTAGVDAVASVVLSPATLVSENATPDEQGEAAIELMAAAAHRAGQVSKALKKEFSAWRAARKAQVEDVVRPRTKTIELGLDDAPTAPPPPPTRARRAAGDIAEAITEPEIRVASKETKKIVVDGAEVTKRIAKPAPAPAPAPVKKGSVIIDEKALEEAAPKPKRARRPRVTQKVQATRAKPVDLPAPSPPRADDPELAERLREALRGAPPAAVELPSRGGIRAMDLYKAHLRG